MKKIIYLVLITVAMVAPAILIAYNLFNPVVPKESILGARYFLHDLSGTEFKFTPGSQKTLIIYYSPDCESCIYEVTAIAKSYHLFDQFRLYLVSNQPADKIRAFISKTSFPGKEEMFLYDKNNRFQKSHHIRVYPTVIITDRAGRIIRRIEGEMKIGAILSILNND